METLLIEIGAEEIPAGYIIPALNAFSKTILSELDKARIDHGEAQTFGTPRRLALMVEKVALTQKAQTSTITGPPAKVGFDADGKPTIAAQKFAQKAGISVDKIEVVTTEKGEYLTAVVEEECIETSLFLEGILEKAILSIPFPKSMRWGDLSISFARPIISLTGFLGKQALTFSVGNITSSNTIMGHSFMHPGAHPLSCADDYAQIARKAGVEPSIEKRKELLTAAIEDCAKAQGVQIIQDDELVDLVTNLVEYPYPVVGSFDKDFLEVPDEVLITAMREHQKYFALSDEKGRLINKFIAVNNTPAKDMELVARGHEKVLRARLSDAKFFYEVDKKSTLDAFAQKLKQVTFQEKLGSVYDKTLRIAALGSFISQNAGYQDEAGLETKVKRACEICKADLVSQVVIEFTKLQGVIGRAYALEAGEDAEVAHAIEQHYRPVYSGGQLPESPTAAVLAIGDKMDTICGCFSLGLIPTGGADPYALRRQGIGILQIMQDQKLELSLKQVIQKGLEPFKEYANNPDETAQAVEKFLTDRMVNILVDAGYSREAVQSALQVSCDNIPDALQRVSALDTLRKEPDFEPLAVTFKRVENIIRKSGADAANDVDAALFEDASESKLYDEVTAVKSAVDKQTASKDYDQALKTISTLRPVVDTFFDDVMVMAEDEKIRANRLALLGLVSELFRNIADFSKI